MNRAFHIAGVAATSNMLAGKRYGVPVAGTMAHSYIQAHDDEAAAFEAFARLYPETTLLVDTYDTLAGVVCATAGLFFATVVKMMQPIVKERSVVALVVIERDVPRDRRCDLVVVRRDIPQDLDGLGLLADDTTYVHCNTLSDHELRLIADTGGGAAISPEV
jgi:hypothetical protein